MFTRRDIMNAKTGSAAEGGRIFEGKVLPLPRIRPAHTATGSCQVNERRVGAVTILDLHGELRSKASRDALHDAVERLSGEGRNQILLNLTRLTGVDAGGLGELLQSGVKLNKAGGQLKLLRPAHALRKMMSIAWLLNIFDIYESEAEAVAGFANPLLDSEGQLLSYEYARYETHP